MVMAMVMAMVMVMVIMQTATIKQMKNIIFLREYYQSLNRNFNEK